MSTISKLFNVSKPIIGMIHIDALPGTPKNQLNNAKIITKSVNEALVYQTNGVDGLIIENMHDTPYLKTNVGHEISTLMAIIGYEIKNKTQLPVGIQILAGANNQALAVAHSASLDFIRAEGFVFGHVADEGYFDSCAAELLRYRKQIGADNISIFTDIKKKHSSHAITSDVDIVETAEAASFFCSDGLIITGSSTGKQANVNDIKMVKEKSTLPVIVGSGIDYHNIDAYFAFADAFIVGSSFKTKGYWQNPIDKKAVSDFIEKVNRLRKV